MSAYCCSHQTPSQFLLPSCSLDHRTTSQVLFTPHPSSMVHNDQNSGREEKVNWRKKGSKEERRGQAIANEAN